MPGFFECCMPGAKRGRLLDERLVALQAQSLEPSANLLALQQAAAEAFRTHAGYLSIAQCLNLFNEIQPSGVGSNRFSFLSQSLTGVIAEERQAKFRSVVALLQCRVLWRFDEKHAYSQKKHDYGNGTVGGKSVSATDTLNRIRPLMAYKFETYREGFLGRTTVTPLTVTGQAFQALERFVAAKQAFPFEAIIAAVQAGDQARAGRIIEQAEKAAAALHGATAVAARG